MEQKKICIGITGASGSLYASLLINRLKDLGSKVEVSLIFSETGRKVWEFELPGTPIDTLPFRIYSPHDYFAPMASGSSGFTDMIIIPCTMGTLGRIASGTSDDLICRAADVMLKERKRLILVPRESPYNLAHIKNMELVTLSGGIICPASPSFYSYPTDIVSLASTVIDRVLSLIDLKNGLFEWGKTTDSGFGN